MDGKLDRDLIESEFPGELRFWRDRRNENLLRKALSELLGEDVTSDMIDDLDPSTVAGLLAWREVEMERGAPKPQQQKVDELTIDAASINVG